MYIIYMDKYVYIMSISRIVVILYGEYNWGWNDFSVGGVSGGRITMRSHDGVSLYRN